MIFGSVAVSALVTWLLVPHLLAVNVASAAPLVCVWLEWSAARGNRLAATTARRLSAHGAVALVVGALIGLLMGWLLWSDSYRTALRLLGSRLHYGGAELLFSLVLMIWHAVWWARRAQASRLGRWGRGLLAVLAGTNVLYHFPVLMVILARIAAGADALETPLDSPAFRARLVSPEVAARCLHIVFASFAVTGAWLIALAWRDLGRTAAGHDGDANSQADAAVLARWGARLAVVPTLLQLPSGLWLVGTLTPVQQSRLFGGDAAVTSAFGASVLLSLWLMHLLAAIGMGDVRRSMLAKTLVVLTAVVALMSFVLRTLELRS